MAQRYATQGTRLAPAVPPGSIVALISATTIRPRIYQAIFGCGATPADQAYKLELLRFSASSLAAIAVTPYSLDPADPPALATGQQTFTVEPTYTDSVMTASLNQQATWRWEVAPSQGIVLPATADNGVGMRFTLVSGGTPLCEATLYHEE